MVVFTLKSMCTTMIADGFQPALPAWCVVRWRTRCGRGVIGLWQTRDMYVYT